MKEQESHVPVNKKRGEREDFLPRIYPGRGRRVATCTWEERWLSRKGERERRKCLLQCVQSAKPRTPKREGRMTAFSTYSLEEKEGRTRILCKVRTKRGERKACLYNLWHQTRGKKVRLIPLFEKKPGL